VYFKSPNSLVVSHKLKIFTTTPGQVLHSVVKERVSTPTNSTVFHSFHIFWLMLLYQCWIWYYSISLRSVQTQPSVYGSLYFLLIFLSMEQPYWTHGINTFTKEKLNLLGANMIWYMIRYDMMWYMIWCDIWYDMIWCDIWYDIWYYIFVNCNWVVTRWQKFSTHLHTNST
jgi:hypothetical protein